jgi:ketosteroid isomerase-like protein
MTGVAANRFIEALHRAERQHDPGPLLPLFSERSELMNLAGDEPHKGIAGAREFWQEYFAFFESIGSGFHNILEADGTAILEWSSEGRLKSGNPVAYRGVTILEMEGTTIRSFRTYYDTAALLRVTA